MDVIQEHTGRLVDCHHSPLRGLEKSGELSECSLSVCHLHVVIRHIRIDGESHDQPAARDCNSSIELV